MFDVVRIDLRGFNAAPAQHLRWLLGFGPQALLVYRLGRWILGARRHPARLVPALLLGPVYALLVAYVRLAYDIRLELSADIGPGMKIFHFTGIRLRACRIGQGCVVHHGVRVEPSADGGPGPRIGSRVWIGPHATIIGPVRIGDGATISAGAVVTRDVGPECLVAGSPARTARVQYDNSALL